MPIKMVSSLMKPKPETICAEKVLSPLLLTFVQEEQGDRLGFPVHQRLTDLIELSFLQNVQRMVQIGLSAGKPTLFSIPVLSDRFR